MGQVKIGPEFFSNVKLDYANWRFAFARELMQNAIDARATKITVDIKEGDEDLIVTFYDNGCGMTKETITDRFLTLGGTHKVTGNVGGFGVAKSIIAFAHKNYEIVTNDIRVVGCGADYEIIPNPQAQGTKIEVNLGTTENVYTIKHSFESFMQLSQWDGSLYINGEVCSHRMIKGFYRKTLDWCDIYTNNSANGSAIIRIGGMCMFTYPITADKTVILELKGSSKDILTANRDGLQSKYHRNLIEFVEQLTCDSRSALKSDFVKTMVWSGSDLGTDGKHAQATINIAAKASVNELVLNHSVESAHTYEFAFIIRNETGLDVPDYFTPPAFSKWAEKLIKAWANVLVELHDMLKVSGTFGVGFCITADNLAQFLTYVGKKYFLISPAEFTRFSSIKKNSRWGFTGGGKMAVIEAAVHEITHAQGYPNHDESFISKYGENWIIVAQNLKLLHKHFKG